MCMFDPNKPHFHGGVRKKVKGQITAQKKQVYHCATETGRGTALTGHYLLVTVEQLE